MKKIILLIFSLLSLPCYANWQGWLFAQAGYGWVKGFSQTPKGGNIGTTTLGRPTFEEIHLKHDNYQEWGAGLRYGSYFTILDYQSFNLDGENILTEDLTTHAKTIPKNTLFNMHIQYHWFSLLLGKAFQYHRWLWSPLLQGNWIKYAYDFTSIHQSRRAFSLSTLSAGLKIQYHFEPQIWLEMSGLQSLPINRVSLSQMNLTIHYTIEALSSRFIPKIGVGYLQMDYRDHQVMPNHIRYALKPYFFVGLTWLLI